MRISDWSSDVCSSDLTDVESTHRKLRARLTDGLGGNDTHGFAAVDQVAPAQIAAIAMRAQTMTRFAGQRRTYLDPVAADAIELGEAPCRERVCQSGQISVVALIFKKNTKLETS